MLVSRWCRLGKASKNVPTMKLALEGELAHGRHSVLAWMIDNIHVRTDPAGNIKPDKQKSTEKIDGVVATIMAPDRAIRKGSGQIGGNVYDERELLVFEV